MGPLARLLLFLLKRCPSVSVVVTPQDPSLDPEKDISDHIDALDDDAFNIWVDYLETMYAIDTTLHDNTN